MKGTVMTPTPIPTPMRETPREMVWTPTVMDWIAMQISLTIPTIWPVQTMSVTLLQTIFAHRTGMTTWGPFNAQEDAFVDALRPDLTKQYWIGLQTGYSSFGGLYWKWSDQTGLGSFVDWGPGQPNGINAFPCVFIQEEGQWANDLCYAPRGYICEERNVTFPE